MHAGESPFWLQAVCHGLWPAWCVGCQSLPTQSWAQPLCWACASALPRNAGLTCSVCDTPVHARDHGPQHPALCPPCTLHAVSPPRRAPHLYAGPMRALVRAAKHGGWARAWRGIAQLTFACPQVREGLRQADAVVFVPSHRARLLERGFEPAGLLAQRLATLASKPLWARALHKRRPTPPQSRLPRSARMANVQGAYRARTWCNGARLVLVDDVVTTGATLQAAAQALQAAGAVHVQAVCAALTPSP